MITNIDNTAARAMRAQQQVTIGELCSSMHKKFEDAGRWGLADWVTLVWSSVKKDNFPNALSHAEEAARFLPDIVELSELLAAVSAAVKAQTEAADAEPAALDAAAAVWAERLHAVGDWWKLRVSELAARVERGYEPPPRRREVGEGLPPLAAAKARAESAQDRHAWRTAATLVAAWRAGGGEAERAWALLSLDLRRGVTTRLPEFSHLGSGRLMAQDGGAWMAAGESALELLAWAPGPRGPNSSIALTGEEWYLPHQLGLPWALDREELYLPISQLCWENADDDDDEQRQRWSMLADKILLAGGDKVRSFFRCRLGRDFEGYLERVTAEARGE